MTSSAEDREAAQAPFAKDLPPLDVETVLRRPETRVTLTGSDELCLELSEMLGVEALDDLRFDGVLTPEDATRLVLEGRIQARVRQLCISTLEPLTSAIDSRVRRIFETTGAEPEGDMEDDEDAVFGDDFAEIEYLEGGPVDIGQAVYEELSLSIDPYPRSADAPDVAEETDAPGPDSDHPFAKLAALKQGPEKDT